MRKTTFLLALLMILVIPVSAQADTMRATNTVWASVASLAA